VVWAEARGRAKESVVLGRSRGESPTMFFNFKLKKSLT
jgi:hypothetical protein